jgi:uncharacterized ion transporter superfamily protein YfcC
MAETKSESKSTLRKFTFKALKATVKAVLFYVVYFVLWTFLAPASELIPGLRLMVETFFIIYIVLMVIGELASGTVFQYFFDGAKALFVISYLILSLNGGLFGVTFENVNLTVDLRLFLAIATLLSLLGFAKSVLQAVNYLNERTEYGASSLP